MPPTDLKALGAFGWMAVPFDCPVHERVTTVSNHPGIIPRTPTSALPDDDDDDDDDD
eukprot:CAMPEP_0195074686 /NCGR_PEP_ID=MMETSP0448-20130528/17732_1 /TAXON_ID=66468 /ORGANISM="Heterocapsa triquestra, Strain CCMP 448" /LENGTH=56 /DNA_ID=CAMNT_0040106973 /DNA_START=145 /DNA_END=312 /DNA_ORIENTATION=-